VSSRGGGKAPHQGGGKLREARSRADELLRLVPDQRAEWLRSEAGRFSALLLAEVLIEESRRRTPAYPRDGYTLASLARLVLHHAPSSLRATALYARALAYMANAVRVIGDLPRADQIMGDARFLLPPRAAATAWSGPSSIAWRAPCGMIRNVRKRRYHSCCGL